MRGFDLAAMLIREWSAAPQLARRPEPETLMDARSQVDAFHGEGLSTLVPVYHFNAWASCQGLRHGGTVVDLGSGSGRYLGYLARCRPDLRIIGIELAPTMVQVGREWLAREGLAGRVDLRVGDMTRFAQDLKEERVDLVSSIFSLHHLPGDAELLACFGQIRTLRERDGCGVWIFDHARPRLQRTAEVFPEVFTPRSAQAFKDDSCNSLWASWRVDEMKALLEQAGLRGLEHRLSRVMRLYQVHDAPGQARPGDTVPDWKAPLPPEAAKDFNGLRWLFPSVGRGR